MRAFRFLFLTFAERFAELVFYGTGPGKKRPLAHVLEAVNDATRLRINRADLSPEFIQWEKKIQKPFPQNLSNAEIAGPIPKTCPTLFSKL